MRDEAISRVAVLLLAAIALGGCLAGPGQVDDTSDRVEPTGKTKTVDLYIRTCDHSPYPGTNFTQWCFSLDDERGSESVPGPAIVVEAGTTLKVRFHNQMSNFAHTVHWHGIHLPWKQDGVPYVTQDPVQPGETFTYEFVAQPSGTFWYHCHVNTEHDTDMGMYGPLIVVPQDGYEHDFDKQETLMFSAFNKYHTPGISPTDSNLPNNGDPLSYEEWARHQAEGLNRNSQYQTAVKTTGVKEERDWHPTTPPPYKPEYNTYMLNGRSFPWTEPVFIEEGETLRLRLISVNTFTTWHLHGHYMQVTHKDGAALPAPYQADTLLVAPGERYSVLVEGNNPGIWAMHSHTPGHVQNDWISPGGIFTTLVYEQYKDQARHVGDVPEGQAMTAQQYMGLYG